jgi:hypothetical protein
MFLWKATGTKSATIVPGTGRIIDSNLMVEQDGTAWLQLVLVHKTQNGHVMLAPNTKKYSSSSSFEISLLFLQ